MICKDTKVCISISSNPGSTGALIHNSLYERYGLDYIYVPRALADHQLNDSITAVRALGIVGCSVSMPFKRRVISLLDQTDGHASFVPTVNTIKHLDGRLIGYNTDVDGVMMALGDLVSSYECHMTPTVVGSGATAYSTVYALSIMGFKEMYLWNRTESKADALAGFVSALGIRACVLKDLNALSADVLINASALGLDDESFPMSDDVLGMYRFVFDVVNSPKQTDLIIRAEALGLKNSTGKQMALYQALKQFEIYTDITLDIPREIEFLRCII